jgi:uncharacterized membrane protein SirB2
MIRLVIGVLLIAVGFFGGNIIKDNANWIIRKVVPLLCYIIGLGLIVGTLIGYIFAKTI